MTLFTKFKNGNSVTVRCWEVKVGRLLKNDKDSLIINIPRYLITSVRKQLDTLEDVDCLLMDNQLMFDRKEAPTLENIIPNLEKLAAEVA